MDVEMKERINALIDTYTTDDFDVVSFVSPRNTNVQAVQFVMKTESIKVAEEPAAEEQTAEPTFWERLLDLFGL